MMRFIKSTIVFASLLFFAQGAQAGLISPKISENLGVFTAAGTVDSAIYALPNGNPAVNWYEFTLGSNLKGSAKVTLDTEILYKSEIYKNAPSTSSVAYIDTILALYDAKGSLILNSEGKNQNDDCLTVSLYSCSTFSLEAGTYIAGVNDGQGMSSFEPFQSKWTLENREYEYVSYTGLSIAVDGAFSPRPVPEPATLWLLSIGLLGLIGVSRRTHLKS